MLPNQRTILLVDDDTLVLQTMRLLLAQRGYVVLSANCGAEALEKMQERDGRVDLVVTDVDMPIMSGTQLATQLLQSYPGLEIIFVSGRSLRDIESSEPLPSSGTFLEKPFLMTDLETIIMQILEVEPSLIRSRRKPS